MATAQQIKDVMNSPQPMRLPFTLPSLFVGHIELPRRCSNEDFDFLLQWLGTIRGEATKPGDESDFVP